MLCTNHTLTGIVIARLVHNPLLIAPLAVASHLALDVVPHFSFPGASFTNPKWLALATVDCLIALGIVGYCIWLTPQHLPSIVAGAFFGTLPDLLFLSAIFLKRPIENAFTRFHSRIQHESVFGVAPEVIWAYAMSGILFR